MLDVIKGSIGRLFSKPQDETLNQAKIQAWHKAATIVGFDPKIIRKDVCGAWIVFVDFQNQTSKNGWDLDILPAESTETAFVYRALHCRNKKSKDTLNAKNPTAREFCVTTAKD